MDVNIPEIVAEVAAQFEKYEHALTTNDVAGLDALFKASPHTIRYGIGENLYGIEEIRSFRSGRSPVNLSRRLARTQITTYGRDLAVAATLFYRDSASGKTGRQMQTWVRFSEGWRVAAAHVSIIPDPA